RPRGGSRLGGGAEARAWRRRQTKKEGKHKEPPPGGAPRWGGSVSEPLVSPSGRLPDLIVRAVLNVAQPFHWSRDSRHKKAFPAEWRGILTSTARATLCGCGRVAHRRSPCSVCSVCHSPSPFSPRSSSRQSRQRRSHGRSGRSNSSSRLGRAAASTSARGSSPID